MSVPSEELLWFFDLGNSSLKGRWSRGITVGKTARVDWHADNVDQRLQDLIGQWPVPSRVLVASVVSQQRADQLRRALRRCQPGRVSWLVSPQRGCGIINAYRRPERLGIDRFLAMVGARIASHGAPLVLVGCGTAMTLDAVDGDGRQLDGMIVPSPHLILRSVRDESTVDETDPYHFRNEFEAAPSDDCKAMYLGSWAAAVALVDHFYSRHRIGLGEIDLWLYGGGAPSLKAAIDSSDHVRAQVRADVVWRGMEEWAASPPNGSGNT
ncbi:MAG: type III pantothenate kinase [Rhodanobacteraceae bacterium]